jgi:methionyl-tRNA formyltransferase
MRIVFFGASALGYRCCERLITMRQEVVGLFTIPRAFNISYSPGVPVENVLHRDFHALGAAHNIPVLSVEGRMADHEQELAALGPDLLVVVGWYYMIPRRMRELAPRGCVGIHASLLPRYRGGAPLVWAMINGEMEAGVTMFHLSDGVDDGDIVGQRRFAIEPRDTIADLLEKAERASLELTEELVPAFAAGTAPRLPQDHGLATHVPQRSPADGRIDWTWDAPRIDRFIRAQTKPYPGAFTDLEGKRVRIWAAEVNALPKETSP